MVQTERDLLNEALKVLNKLTGSKVKQGSIVKEAANGVDALVTIQFAQAEHNFKIELKGEVRENHVINIIEQFGKKKDQWLLVARYIPLPIKDNFKGLGINYLELSGNCYINVGGVFIYVADQKVTPVREIPVGKLWKATGLKFLMAIISDPNLIQASYREIALAAGIAFGSIGPLLEELHAGGYILDQTTLVNREKLIVRWAEVYHATLQPKQYSGRFRFVTPQHAKNWDKINNPEIIWGGEAGGAILTRHLTPEKFIIYSNKPGNELLKLLGIVPDELGNITIFQKFWGNIINSKMIDITKNATPAPPLLVYADLINDMDSRNHEVANRIKEQYLNGK